MPLEILYVALVLFGRRAGLERAEVAALAGSGIDLAGIEPVLAGFQFANHDRPLSGLNGVCASAFLEALDIEPESNLLARLLDKAGMYQMTQEAINEIAGIVAEVAPLPLKDAAWALDRGMLRLDALEGRPTPEQVRRFRAMTPEQQGQYMRDKRAHADDGPMFGYLKRAHPNAADADIKRAIMEAVRFQDDCSKFLQWDGEYWDCIVKAVAQSAKRHPGFLETTYRAAENHLAYLWK